MSPDGFFVLVDDCAPSVVAGCVAKQIEHWHERTHQVQIVEQLVTAGCPEFASRVAGHLQRAALS